MSSSHFLFKLQRNLPVLLLVGILVFSGTALLYAAAPNGGYTPGQTLDPDCAPGDVDCIVNPGVGGAVPTNGLQVVGGGIGLGGELTEAVTSIDAENPATQTLAFGSNNSFENFYVGAGNIDVVGGNVIVDASNLVSILGQTISTNGQGEFRIGDINLSSLFGASFPGVATIYSYEHPSTADIYQMGVFHVEANSFGGIPVSQHMLANSTTGDSGFLRFVDSGGINIALTVDNGTATGLSVNENGAGFIINDVNTFNIPTTAGTNGYVLATDGNGNTSWVAGGGGTPITIQNTASLFSTGLPGPTGVNSLASHSVFFGDSAGVNAINANYSNFLGNQAGLNATDANYSNFLGNQAGLNATDANNANFLGAGAGYLATDAYQSNFFGSGAGQNATNANNANFFGSGAGQNATNANNANFLGTYAGQNATNANNANFLGQSAGYLATDAFQSNFLGYFAGYGATNAANSLFIGTNAGLNDTVNNTLGGSSILLGNNTSTGGFSNSIAIGANAINTASNQFTVASAYNNWNIGGVNYVLPNAQATTAGQVLTNDGAGVLSWTTPSGGGGSSLQWYAESASAPATAPVATGTGSIAIGNNAQALTNNMFVVGDSAGFGATNAARSNFLGVNAGYDATNADNANFLGYGAGSNATFATNANFLGTTAGSNATFANYANFLGTNAGQNATNANNANFLGTNAGQNATDAYQSNFLGYSAGYDATSANNANFFGASAGLNATNANNANFFGTFAGNGATNANESIFIGQQAGNGATNAARSIFLGDFAGNNDTVDNTSTNVAENCGGIACYSILMGSQSSTGGFSNSIAMGAFATNTASNQFMIGSTARPIEEMRIILDNIGGECVIDITGANCSSDETLKTDITDITNALDIVTQLSGVTYHWVNGGETTLKTPGFIAQDVKDILPEAVRYNENTGKYMMNYTQIIPYLVEAIKALNIAVATGTQAGAQVGELVVTTLRAQRVETEMLCIGSICITEEDLAGTGVGEKPDREDATQRPLPEDKPTESSDSTTGDVPKETAPTTTEPTESTEPVVTDPNTVTTETPKEKPTSGEFDTSSVTIDATEPKPADNEVGETGEPDSVIGEAEPKL